MTKKHKRRKKEETIMNATDLMMQLYTECKVMNEPIPETEYDNIFEVCNKMFGDINDYSEGEADAAEMSEVIGDIEFYDTPNFGGKPESWIENGIRYTNYGLHSEFLDDEEDDILFDGSEFTDSVREESSFSELQKKIEPRHESIVELGGNVAISRYLLRGKSCDYEPVYHKIVDGKLACTTKKVIHDFVSIPEETLIPMRVSYKGKRVKICRCKECFK